ncbi:hypothetical protein BSFA1_65140 (plasmid) [Burkholderia sp. SFA1]|nr:hypothetical protein BSFA1_65140 [Burkholderia sp. SFA1]
MLNVDLDALARFKSGVLNPPSGDFEPRKKWWLGELVARFLSVTGFDRDPLWVSVAKPVAFA